MLQSPINVGGETKAKHFFPKDSTERNEELPFVEQKLRTYVGFTILSPDYKIKSIYEIYILCIQYTVSILKCCNVLRSRCRKQCSEKKRVELPFCFRNCSHPNRVKTKFVLGFHVHPGVLANSTQ